MNQFELNLSQSPEAVVKKRAKVTAEDYKAAAEAELAVLKEKKRELDRRKIDLTDFSATSRDSLLIGENSLKPKAWVKEMKQIEIDLEVLGVEIDAVKALIDSFFTDLPEETVNEAK